ncbi:MAG: hypothetical protein HC828_16365, partial [Blastochloris sp.]|nr:hypothetical protein [Blastochloris sp.]
MLQTMKAVQQGQGGVVSLLGEGGIGKTRLISEMIGRLRDQG